MNALAMIWGPVPRILLQFLDFPSHEASFKNKVRRAVDEAITNSNAVYKAFTINSSTAQDLSIIFFVRPASKTQRDCISVYVPTRWLANQLVDGLDRRDENQRATFFHITSTRFSGPFDLGIDA